MKIEEKEIFPLAEYIADYVTDELIKSGEQTHSGYAVDIYLIQAAIAAYAEGQK